MVLYVKRWLARAAAAARRDLAERDRGTPQGSAISPVLANLFMHYAFDAWMAREFPASRSSATPTTRSCTASASARRSTVLAAIADRMAGRAAAAPGQDQDRVLQGRQAARLVRAHVVHVPGVHVPASAGRGTRTGRCSAAFLPAISKDALKKISAEVRSWRLHRRTGHTFAELARRINPIVRGWMQYYGAFYRSALYPLLQRINAYLMRWIRKKYKRLRAKKKAMRVLAGDHRAVSPHVRALDMGALGPGVW